MKNFFILAFAFFLVYTTNASADHPVRHKAKSKGMTLKQFRAIQDWQDITEVDSAVGIKHRIVWQHGDTALCDWPSKSNPSDTSDDAQVWTLNGKVLPDGNE